MVPNQSENGKYKQINQMINSRRFRIHLPAPLGQPDDKSCSLARFPIMKNAPKKQRNLFQILSYQTEIRLCLPCTDCFGTNRVSIWFQINQCMVNTIWFLVSLIRFGKDFSVCRATAKMFRAPGRNNFQIWQIQAKFELYLHFSDRFI